MQESENILTRQKSVKELSEKLSWRQHFQAKGNIVDEADNDKNEISAWLLEPHYFYGHKLYKSLLRIIPYLSFALMVLIIFNVLGPQYLFLYSITLAITVAKIKLVNQQQRFFSKKLQLLKKYKDLLKFIENEEFISEELISLRNTLKKNDKKAWQNLANLSGMINYLDNRQNIIVASVLNAMVLWDILYVYKIEKWKESFKENLPVWFDIIADFDAISSLAGFAWNFPENIYPIVKNGEFKLESENLGHPLIPEKTRVSNDFNNDHPGRLFIITGANMAGKSTFLRTVGVNLILGMNGAPVCAEKFEFSPINILTSVRTNDSLHDNESYFYAELKRLKRVIDELKQGKKLYVIVDKSNGSAALIAHLIKLNACGIIATHDLSLGDLENKYPTIIKNKCFEVEIINDKLIFNYKLYDGISKNMNASFLMKQMGIIVRKS